MKTIDINDFKVASKISLKDRSTNYNLGADKDEIEDELKKVRKKKHE